MTFDLCDRERDLMTCVTHHGGVPADLSPRKRARWQPRLDIFLRILFVFFLFTEVFSGVVLFADVFYVI